MIISAKENAEHKEFKRLLEDTKKLLRSKILGCELEFSQIDPLSFEKVFFESLKKCAQNSIFKNIKLISGFSFPDITLNDYFGIEVKTSKSGNWRSTGNSVLESTRIDNVKIIYIFFAKLSEPVDFKFRLYEECLSNITVTHSPRYLIDMDLPDGESIFDKMGLDYNSLRKLDKPVKPIASYIRSTLKKGEELWWIGNSDETDIESISKITVWNNLSQTAQTKLKIEAMARFPEIFGNSPSKFYALAAWLAARYGVVDYSLRDKFSAGGRVDLVVDGKKYRQLPKIFEHLQTNSVSIFKSIEDLPSADIKFYWNLSHEPSDLAAKFAEWCKKVIRYSSKDDTDVEKFLVHLIVSVLTERCPSFVMEKHRAYGSSS
jgi:hypothetical protein